MKKIKVCIVTKNTLVKDQRTLKEATILAEAGLEVVVIGLLGKEQSPCEQYNGFRIRRVPASLGLAPAFRDYVYLPLYKRLPLRGQKIATTVYKVVSRWLRWIDQKLKSITIYARLSRAMFSEQANYYHAHFPILLMGVALLVAILARARFVRDYNDILVLEKPKIIDSGYYEQEVIWNRPLKDAETERIEMTINSIPSGVSSILDVGCGDGRITNRLASSYPQVVGVDISKEALKHVQTKVIRASAEHLPFKNRSFDLVLTTELLEHLPEVTYRKALGEIKRIAKHWILMGVPWREQLTVAQARCIRCGTVFHVNYHHRSFNASQLKKLFAPEFKLVEIKLTGGERAYYVPLLLWIKRHIGGIWTRTPTTVCPICNTHLYPGDFPERNAVSALCDKWNERIKHHKMSEKSHVIALYQRQGE